MKQSRRSRLVELHDPRPFDEVAADETYGLRLLCHEGAAPGDTLLAALGRAPEEARIRILVGPEGGFTDAEVDAARRAGYDVVSLGARRLRAETAALAAAAGVMLARPSLAQPASTTNRDAHRND